MTKIIIRDKSIPKVEALSKERKKELAQKIVEMERVSKAFYSAAIQIGVHPFIEFCGLMQEYCNVCKTSLAAGIDFSDANEHQGKPLLMHDYQGQYLAEKFTCIFGPTLRENRIALGAFREHLQGHGVKL